jgi:NAD(P)-dependent dehydrogenase (short-subunit alcohol dehydrogenase family)
VGRAYWGAYSVSKFGIEGLAQVLGDELEKTPVRVNCINPGSVRTRLRARAYPAENPATLPPPEALVAPYLFLLGPKSRGITRRRFDAQAGGSRVI